ncbi:lytic transglycosylase domain-containing protein [Mangrovitalea sediminis]|uniref:lytic transglycosylase domain-containing protein n=1 Tax=Mangrovitalea sediminis TaxID=1982043 RepID=UPI000BE57D8B|nr:lytic transglycosylase domain-containing protein [Mangrovitalea sediminis]
MTTAVFRCLLSLLFTLAFSHTAWASSSTHTMQTPDAAVEAALKKVVDNPSSFKDKFDAEVWLVDMSGRLARYVPNPEKRLKLLKLIHEEATQAGLTPELVLAVIQVESLFDRFAISSVGAQGLMQVMPFWKKEIGRPNDNLTHIETNLRYGCTILKHYIDEEHGNVMRGLARYNGSTGKVWYAERVMDAWQNHWYVNNQ